MAETRIQVLGGLRLTHDGADVPPPTSRKARSLLGYLLRYPAVEHPRERLAGLFWGDSAEPRARQSLRQALTDVRRTLDGLGGYAWLEATDHSVTLRADCAIDVAAFLRDSEPVASGPPSERLTGDALAALERAGAMSAGAFLPECADEWCDEERERLAARRLRALQAVLAAARADGDPARVQQVGRALLEADPLLEDVHRAVMEAAARAGDRAAALRQYAALTDVLQRELGADPDPETVRLYERIRDGALGTALSEGPAGGVLVDRDAELAALAARLAEARAGRGGARLVLLSGPAGTGKSRLAAEAAARARGDGWTVVEADAGAGGRPQPFGAWASVLRALLLNSPDLAASLSPPVLAGVARLIPEARHLAARSGREPTRSDLFAGVAAVLRVACRRAPLLLLFDDLHWADADTLQLLAYTTRQSAALPLLALGTARDDPMPDAAPLPATLEPLRQEGLLAGLPVPPLSREGVRALLRSLAGDESIAASLTDTAYAETAGNPLHLGELWRMMQEEGRLERDASGRWRWRGGLFGRRERLPLPVRVRATIAGRIAALSAEARGALTLGAILGRAWTLETVEAVSGASGAWEPAIEEAVRHGLAARAGDSYRFAHDVVRETVERETDATGARVLHLRAGEVLEGRYASDLAPHAADLARHFALAGPRGAGRAFRYTRLAAERSRDLFAHEQAAEYFRLALEYAEGGLLADPAALGGLQSELAEVLARTGRITEAAAAADSAIASFEQGADPRLVTLARVRLARLFDANVYPHIVLRVTGEAAESAEITDEYTAGLHYLRAYAWDRLLHPEALLKAVQTLAVAAGRTGNERIALSGRLAEATLRSNYSLDQPACAALRLELRDAYDRLGDPFLAVECLADAADSLVRVGRLHEARPLLDEAARLARGLHGAWAAFRPLPVLMELELTAGNFTEVDALYEELRPALTETVPGGRVVQMLGSKGVADMWRGRPAFDFSELGMHSDPEAWREIRFIGQVWAAIESGAFAQARALLDQLAPLVPHTGEGMRWAVSAITLVYNYNRLGLGEVSAAWYDTLARHGDFQVPGANARMAAAQIALLTGRYAEAEALLCAAVAHYEREGMRPFLAQAWLEQANLAFATGDTATGRAHLDRAEALMQQLGMVWWLARARTLRRSKV